MSLSPEVQNEFPGFTQQFEGYITWMYLDEKGYVTTGVGDLIDPITMADELPWKLADGVTLATQSQITAEWTRVKCMRPYLEAQDYKIPSSLCLTHSDINQLVVRTLLLDVPVLEQFFRDLSKYPAQVQLVLCSMAWAMGPAFPDEYPLFTAAVLRGDWKTAAGQCAISTVNDAGVEPRNIANKKLLLELVSAT